MHVCISIRIQSQLFCVFPLEIFLTPVPEFAGILTLAITTFNRPSACFSCIRASIQYISSLKLSIDLLVIDDCSTVTEELNILYKYLDFHNIPCIRHPFNHGLAASRNTAISHCRTDWIAFCDDDDIWSEKSFILFSSAILRANKLHAQMILGLTSPSLSLFLESRL